MVADGAILQIQGYCAPILFEGQCNRLSSGQTVFEWSACRIVKGDGNVKIRRILLSISIIRIAGVPEFAKLDNI